VPESDNVAESGEESEDEWNYYRVEPTAEGNQETTQPVHTDHCICKRVHRESMIKAY
jgi:hypothetical protein